MLGDLHCHTRLSDGSMGIGDIIILAEKLGVTTLAITDHDCLAGTIRAKLIGERHGVKVIPGAEISSFHSGSGREVHIICYLCDSPDRLEGLCHRNLVARKRAAQLMMIKAAQRYNITTDLILQCAQGSTNVYPIHIMSALVECGMADELYGSVYHELFDENSENNILVKPKFEEPEAVVKAIHDAGGIAILAHPGDYEDTDILSSLVEAGIDGIEVWCPSHSDEQIQKYSDFAKDNNLVTIGGSDFHGRYNKKCVTLGKYNTPDERMNEFLNYKNKLRRINKTNATV